MEIPVLREPAAMILIGSWLLLQCYDSVVREDVKAHLFCVSGKLVFVTGFLLLYPFPAYGLLYFFSFYPKTERNGSSLWLSGLQLVFPAGAAFLCGAGKRQKRASFWQRAFFWRHFFWQYRSLCCGALS